MTRTFSPKVSEITRNWHVLDASNQILGRLASQAAILLMGKNKPGFTRHLDTPHHMVILNGEKIMVTGNKEATKVYTRHSGYPGGLTQTTLDKLRVTQPTHILAHAVEGMLPDNKLQSKMMKRLHVVVGSDNPYAKYIK